MIAIDIDTRAIDQALSRLSQQVSNMQPIMTEIGEEIASRVDLTFTDATDPYGNPWEALSAITQARRTNGSNKPLNDTGRLKASITSNASSHDVEIGTNVKYAKTHQNGASQGQYGKNKRNTPIPWGDIPARPFLPTQARGLPSDWETDILKIIQKHLERAV